MTIAQKIRELRPRVVIIPYWEARHPDHYRAGEMAYEACFLAGLKKIDPYTEPHRPYKVVYSSQYANVPPTLRGRHHRRSSTGAWIRCSPTASQYGEMETGSGLFPPAQEVRERLAAMARFYGNLIGVKYGEAFVVKETMRVDDLVAMPVRSF